MIDIFCSFQDKYVTHRNRKAHCNVSRSKLNMPTVNELPNHITIIDSVIIESTKNAAVVHTITNQSDNAHVLTQDSSKSSLNTQHSQTNAEENNTNSVVSIEKQIEYSDCCVSSLNTQHNQTDTVQNNCSECSRNDMLTDEAENNMKDVAPIQNETELENSYLDCHKSDDSGKKEEKNAIMESSCSDMFASYDEDIDMLHDNIGNNSALLLNTVSPEKATETTEEDPKENTLLNQLENNQNAEKENSVIMMEDADEVTQAKPTESTLLKNKSVEKEDSVNMMDDSVFVMPGPVAPKKKSVLLMPGKLYRRSLSLLKMSDAVIEKEWCLAATGKYK